MPMDTTKYRLYKNKSPLHALGCSAVFLHQLDLYQWPRHAIIDTATWSVLVDSNTLSIVFRRYMSEIVLLFYVCVLVQIENVVTNFFRNTFLHF